MINIDYLLQLHLLSKSRSTKPIDPVEPELPSQIGKIYGVTVDMTNTIYDVNYIDDAVGLTPAKMNFTTDKFEYGSWNNRFPFNQIKPCLLKNGVVNYYLDPNDYSKKIDGTVADITSGADGNVMIEFPKLYWKIETIGNVMKVRYSDIKVDSTYQAIAHQKGVGLIQNNIYISAYSASENINNTNDIKLSSLSGRTAYTSINQSIIRNYTSKIDPSYSGLGYYQLTMLQLLYVVMFKSVDSQSTLGNGLTDGARIFGTGNLDTKGLFYGSNSYDKQVKFCGIEDFYGNFVSLIEGAHTSGGILRLAFDEYGKSTSYVDYGKVNSYLGHRLIKSVMGITNVGFTPKVSEYVASYDKYFYDTTYIQDDAIATFGGGMDAKRRAGVFNLDFRYDFNASIVATTNLVYR